MTRHTRKPPRLHALAGESTFHMAYWNPRERARRRKAKQQARRSRQKNRR